MAELRTKSGVHLDAFQWDGDMRAFEAWFGASCPVDFKDRISVPNGQPGRWLSVWCGSWVLRIEGRCWAIPDDLKRELFDLFADPPQEHKEPSRG